MGFGPWSNDSLASARHLSLVVTYLTFWLSGCRQPPFEVFSSAPLWRTAPQPLKRRGFLGQP